jgi:hypothetical protein
MSARVGLAGVRYLGPGMGHGSTQVLRGRAGGGCLGGVLLGVAQFGDGGSERGEVRQQRRSEQGGVVGEVTGHGQQPRGRAQAIPVAAGARDAAEGCPRGPIVGVGRAPYDRAAQRPRRDMQCVSCRPRCVGRCGRVAVGAAADVLRRPCGLAGRMLVDRVPFRNSEPERGAVARSTAGCLGPVAAG